MPLKIDGAADHVTGVSTPTVVRFERHEKNVTLKSVFALLKILGLVKDSV